MEFLRPLLYAVISLEANYVFRKTLVSAEVRYGLLPQAGLHMEITQIKQLQYLFRGAAVGVFPGEAAGDNGG